jgi:endonuclease III
MALKAAIAKLARTYPAEKTLDDPLAMLVWENIGYLIDDDRRAELFAEFKTKIGLKAPEIANAPMPVLADIARRGGMHPQKRAERILEIGRLAITESDGRLTERLKALPLAKARALLKKFPGIGDPGADKVLLFAGIAPQPAVDSNGLRAMVRLGLCVERKSYAQTYKAAVAVLARENAGAEWLRRAFLVLRAHGKVLCKRSAPICEPCPLDPVCAHKAVIGTL